MRWYIVQPGSETASGPFDVEQIRSMAQVGLLTPQTLLRREDMAEPVPASRIRGLLPSAPADTTAQSEQPAPPRSGSDQIRGPGWQLWASIAGGLVGVVMLTVLIWPTGRPGGTGDQPEAVPGQGIQGRVDPPEHDVKPDPTTPAMPAVRPAPVPPPSAAPAAQAPASVQEAVLPAAAPVTPVTKKAIPLQSAPFELASGVSVIAVSSSPVYMHRPSRQEAIMRQRARAQFQSRPPTMNQPNVDDSNGVVVTPSPPAPDHAQAALPEPIIELRPIRIPMQAGFMVVLRLAKPVSLIQFGDCQAKACAKDGTELAQRTWFMASPGANGMPGGLPNLLGIKEPTAVGGMPVHIADLSFGAEVASADQMLIHAVAWIVPPAAAFLDMTRSSPEGPASVRIAVDSPYTPDQVAAMDRQRKEAEAAMAKAQEASRAAAIPAGGKELDDGMVVLEGDVVVPLGSTLRSWALAGDGAVLVALTDKNRLVAVDLRQRRQLAERDLGDGRFHIAAAGSRVVIADLDAGALRTADVAKLEPGEAMPLSGSGRLVAVGMAAEVPDAVVTYTGEGEVAVRNLADGQVRASFKVPSLGEKVERCIVSPRLRYACVGEGCGDWPVMVDLQTGSWNRMEGLRAPSVATDDGRLLSQMGEVQSTRLAADSFNRIRVEQDSHQDATYFGTLSPRFQLAVSRDLGTVTLIDTERKAPCGSLGLYPAKGRRRSSVNSTDRIIASIERGICAFATDGALVVRTLPDFAVELARRGGVADVRNLLDFRIGEKLEVPDLFWPAGRWKVKPMAMPPGVAVDAAGKLTWSGECPADWGRTTGDLSFEVGSEQGLRTVTIPYRMLPAASPGIVASLPDKGDGTGFTLSFPGAPRKTAGGPAPEMLLDYASGCLDCIVGDRIHVFGRDMRARCAPIPIEHPCGFWRAAGGVLLGFSTNNIDVYDVKAGRLMKSIPWSSNDGIVSDCALDAKAQVAWLASESAAAPKMLDRQRILRLDLRTGNAVRMAKACGNRLILHPDGWIFSTMSLPPEVRREYLMDRFGRGIVLEQVDNGSLMLRYAIEKDDLVPQDFFGVPFGLESAVTHRSDFAMTGDGAVFWLASARLVTAYSAKPSEPGPIDGSRRYASHLQDIPGTSFLLVNGPGDVVLINRVSGAIIDNLPLTGAGFSRLGVVPTPDATGLVVLEDRSGSGQPSLLVFPGLLARLGVPTTTAPPPEHLRPMLAVKPPGPQKPAATRIHPPANAFDGRGTALRTRRAPKDVAAAYADAVVVVQQADGSGTGFFIGSKGWILTCAHVVEGAGKVTVTHAIGKANPTRYTAAIAAIDPVNDLALLKIDAARPLPVVHLDPTHEPAMGEAVVVIGNPGLGNQILERTLTTGVLSNPNRMIDGLSYLQTNAAINPGNSGGPVFDESGNAIGVVVLKGNIEGTAFAVPPSRIAAFLAACLRP